MRSSYLINRFQLILGDGIEEMRLPSHGWEEGDRSETWRVPAGEHITQIEYYWDNSVRSITFITNKGNKSPVFGQRQGQTEIINIAPGSRIVGDYGRAYRAIDRLGFYVAKTYIPDSDHPESAENWDIKMLSVTTE